MKTNKVKDKAKAKDASRVKEPAKKRAKLAAKTTERQAEDVPRGEGAAYVNPPGYDRIEIYFQDGDHEECWSLERRDLCKESRYFRDLYKNKDPKHHEVISLQNTDPAIFDLFAQFLEVNGRYCVRRKKGSDLLCRRILTEVQMQHVEAWILGYDLASPSFANYAMSQLVSTFDFQSRPMAVSPNAALRAYEAATRVPHEIRRVFVDAIAYGLLKGGGFKMSEDNDADGWGEVLFREPMFVKRVLLALDEGQVRDPSLHIEDYYFASKDSEWMGSLLVHGPPPEVWGEPVFYVGTA